MIEVLHLSGSEAGFIAGQFQGRFAAMAALAGALGGLGAIGVGAAARLVSGGSGLAPVLPLAWIDLLVPLPCPLIAALIAAITARLAAVRILRAMP